MFKGTNQNTTKTGKKMPREPPIQLKSNLSLVPGAQLIKKLLATN
jgi:hypothetical protein